MNLRLRFIIQSLVSIMVGMLFICHAESVQAEADDEKSVPSMHAGFFYPNGVDVAGYTIEQHLDSAGKLYRFYTFGLPSFAAMGISYYENFSDTGFVATVGVGIGFVFYSSVAYQWRIDSKQYVKLGAGYAAGIAYAGAYPALSYEYRLD